MWSQGEHCVVRVVLLMTIHVAATAAAAAVVASRRG